MTLRGHNFRAVVMGAFPGTITQIAARAGVSRSTAVNWVRAIRADGNARIAGWEQMPQGGKYTPIYALGSKPDAPCRFKPMTQFERQQRSNKRAKQDETYDIRRARYVARQRADRAAAAKTPNTWLSALGAL